jgi:hypothetical protein
MIFIPLNRIKHVKVDKIDSNKVKSIKKYENAFSLSIVKEDKPNTNHLRIRTEQRLQSQQE